MNLQENSAHSFTEGSEFEQPEEKQHPVTAEEIENMLVGIETMMFSSFLQGKEGGTFYDWYERNKLKESFKRILEEYLRLKLKEHGK